MFCRSVRGREGQILRLPQPLTSSAASSEEHSALRYLFIRNPLYEEPHCKRSRHGRCAPANPYVYFRCVRCNVVPCVRVGPVSWSRWCQPICILSPLHVKVACWNRHYNVHDFRVDTTKHYLSKHTRETLATRAVCPCNVHTISLGLLFCGTSCKSLPCIVDKLVPINNMYSPRYM